MRWIHGVVASIINFEISNLYNFSNSEVQAPSYYYFQIALPQICHKLNCHLLKSFTREEICNFTEAKYISKNLKFCYTLTNWSRNSTENKSFRKQKCTECLIYLIYKEKSNWLIFLPFSKVNLVSCGNNHIIWEIR